MFRGHNHFGAVRIDRIVRSSCAAVLVLIVGTQLVRPFQSGTSHEVTFAMQQPPCRNTWGVADGEYQWRGMAPDVWFGKSVRGTMRVIDNESAEFTAGDVHIKMYGGRNAFFTLQCTLP
jgi:hypothetical protein